MITHFIGNRGIADLFESVPVINQKKIVDYFESMPDDIQTFVKLNIGNPEFLAHHKRGNSVIHEFCSFQKYLKDPTITSSPQKSDFQKEYCILQDKIHKNARLPRLIIHSIEKVMNMPCYNTDSLVQIEVSIGETLVRIAQDQGLQEWLEETAYIFTNMVIPYKVKAYDLYSYLIMNPELRMRERDYNHIQTIIDMINRIIFEPAKTSMNDYSDIANLLYIYYHELGITEILDKYHIFDRYKYAILFCTPDNADDNLDYIQSYLNERICTKSSLGAAINDIVVQKDTDKSIKSTNNEIPVMHTSSNIDENNGAIVTMPYVKDIDQEEMAHRINHLRLLTKEEISHYIDFDIKYLSFELSENDIGHLRNEANLDVGTIYDSFTKEMFYIIKHENELYVVFKNRINTRVLYGLSLKYTKEKDSPPKTRKLFQLVESKSIQYKYISND